MGEVNEIYYIYIYIYKKNTCCNFDVDVIKERKEMIEHSCLKKTRIYLYIFSSFKRNILLYQSIKLDDKLRIYK